MAGHPSAAWAVAGETEKSGAGLLFFAYGGKQLGHFLDEAQTAARSFRRLNPKIRIALVSNTRRPLDNRTWDVQIRPRPDLLFAGGLNNGDWGDSLPRQWLTRLYYLAHSPFKITWALDSNVYACTPGSAQAFLDDALRRELWGYDIATANQRDGPMYPHNFNLVYRWSDRTSALLRDWFLLQIRRGVDSDDQKTLLFAELRQVTAGGLAVGQVATPYAAAFYTAVSVRTPECSDQIRLSRVMRGPAHIVHSRNPADCDAINAHADKERQLLQVAHRGEGDNKSTVTILSAFSLDECERALAGFGLVEKYVSFHGGLGKDKLKIRKLCRFRDVGPRITRTLYDWVHREGNPWEALPLSAATALVYTNQLQPRVGWNSYNTTAKPLEPPKRPDGSPFWWADFAMWPPIFKPPLEALNLSVHFGPVELIDGSPGI